MHYPYNPGISKPPLGYETANTSANIDASRPAQNTIPPTPGPPSPPSVSMPPTPTMPGAPAPSFPTPPQPSLPEAFGPLPGTSFPFGTSPGAIMPPDQPIFPLPTTPAPIQPIPIQPLPTSPAPTTDTGSEAGSPPTATRAPLVQTVEFAGQETPFTGSPVPTVVPSPPHFSVPSNPLLPEHYKEILSYESLQYMNGFLRTQIGKECLVTMDFGGGGASLSRFGYLVGVGLNYLLLQDSCSNEILVCDFYSVRLVELLGRRCPVDLNIQ